MSFLLAAALTVGVNLVSFHTQPAYEAYKYETFTPGLYVKAGERWFVDGGAYRNSQGFATFHVGGGYSYEVGKWDFSVSAGASYGYREWHAWIRTDGSSYITYGPAQVKPFVIPSVGYALSDKWKVRAFILPQFDKEGASCLSFGIERKL